MTVAPSPLRLGTIDVWYPDHLPSRDGPDATMMTTSLNREDVFLPELMGEVYQRRRKAGELCVISAACSIGTEIDGVLGLHKLADDDRPIKAIGIDINRQAADRARTASYWLPLGVYRDQELENAKELLGRLGFMLGEEPIYRLNEPWGEMGYLKIDAIPVRQGHDVQFYQHDLRQGMPTNDKADLVLANHLLYHLRPDDAMEVVKHLVSSVRRGGLLRMGGKAFREMRDSRILYPDWLGRASKWLIEEADFKQIYVADDPDAVAFEKQ